MCDYSLHSVSSRRAKVGDKVVATELARSNARVFAAVGEFGAKLVIHDSPPKVAVCLLPGTELAFDDDVRYERAFSLFGKARVNHKVARFRQIDLDVPHVQHDALEFPGGQVLKVARLAAGQTATVLQLPVTPQRPEPVETGHVVRSSDSRVALNRAFKPGTAPILVPNQATAMLWQAFRSTAIRLSIALVQSFRRLQLHKQLPTGIDAGEIESGFKKDVLTATLPTKSAARENEIEVEAAA
jgi:hypothetical protein